MTVGDPLVTVAFKLSTLGHRQSSLPSVPVAIPAALPPSHAPSLAGSVIEASNGLGGTALIRIQNMSSTGRFSVWADTIGFV